MKKVLIQDIAAEMGMSRNTVAKALKNDEMVLETTREKIISKAYEMGYRKLDPQMIEKIKGEKLEKSGKTRKFVILMGEYGADDFWNGVVLGISERIKKENGSCLIVFATPEDEENLSVPAVLGAGDVEGVVCLTVFSREYNKVISELGIPIVFMDAPVLRVPYRQDHDIILLEGTQSVYALTVDLIKRGCKSLGFIGDITYCESIYTRWKGFLTALEDNGLLPEKRFCLTEGRADRYYSPETIEEKLEELEELPDAIVCANDYIAIVVIQYCKKKGIDVPGQVAVTGFDNKKECLIMEPAITSVNTTNRRIGFRIADQLLWRLKNPTMHREIITIATEPYFRKSSAR